MTKTDERIEKRQEIYNAIARGMERAEKLEKPCDKVLAVQASLKDAGFTIVRQRS